MPKWYLNHLTTPLKTWPWVPPGRAAQPPGGDRGVERLSDREDVPPTGGRSCGGRTGVISKETESGEGSGGGGRWGAASEGMGLGRGRGACSRGEGGECETPVAGGGGRDDKGEGRQRGSIHSATAGARATPTHSAWFVPVGARGGETAEEAAIVQIGAFVAVRGVGCGPDDEAGGAAEFDGGRGQGGYWATVERETEPAFEPRSNSRAAPDASASSGHNPVTSAKGGAKRSHH